jgi:hypothetical protein
MVCLPSGFGKQEIVAAVRRCINPSPFFTGRGRIASKMQKTGAMEKN